MGHTLKTALIPGAPHSDDIELVKTHFRHSCNCYSYAVQDYLAGELSTEHWVLEDYNYLPRPGQTRGNSYLDLKGQNVQGMRRAVHEDGLMFAGVTYPKKIPEDYYVICCFLEPKEYHFIRQNQDGSWSSKDGRKDPSNLDCFGEPLTNPENYYHGDKNYPFVGYFFVPKGGIRVGIKAYEKKRLKDLSNRSLLPQEKKEYSILKDLVSFTDEAEKSLQSMVELSYKKGTNVQLELAQIKTNYAQDLERLSASYCRAGYKRRSLLKNVFTSGKKKCAVLER